MSVSEEFKAELIRRIPDLEKFARVLTRSAQDSEDLMQDTIITALRKADEFVPGTNMVAWLFTLQRGLYQNMVKRARTRQNYVEAHKDNDEAQLPDQLDHLILEDAKTLISKLPVEQQSALFLVCYDGRSYAEAAEVLGCSVGTVKSRVSRARAEIARALDMDNKGSEERFAPQMDM